MEMERPEITLCASKVNAGVSLPKAQKIIFHLSFAETRGFNFEEQQKQTQLTCHGVSTTTR